VGHPHRRWSRAGAAPDPPAMNPAGRQPAKLAGLVASGIESDIIERGWPVGQVIGSEAELLDRYAVSRGVLREAVRLVEHKQVARMRRGRGGGLVVTAPDEGPAVDAVAVYVRYADVTLSELFEARKIVEGAATELASAALTETDIAELRAGHESDPAPSATADQDPHELHRMIGRLSANPALDLFSIVLTRLTALYVGSVRVSPAGRRQGRQASTADHTAIVDALLGGNAQLAVHHMHRHLDGLEEFLRRRRASQSVDSELLGFRTRDARSKRGEDLARTVFREVAQRGWPVGEVLGSETDLVERYGVSRAVLREAARLLEFHQIASMRRGPGGGLVVTEPGLGAIVDTMTLCLEYRGIEPRHLYEARVALELATVEMTTVRLDEHGAVALHAGLRQERADGDADLNEVGHDVHLLIGSLSGNRLLDLFLRIVVQLSANHTPPPRTRRSRASVAAEVHRTHDLIVEAIVAGDAALARHRTQRHLAALVPWYA